MLPERLQPYDRCVELEQKKCSRVHHQTAPGGDDPGLSLQHFLQRFFFQRPVIFFSLEIENFCQRETSVLSRSSGRVHKTAPPCVWPEARRQWSCPRLACRRGQYVVLWQAREKQKRLGQSADICSLERPSSSCKIFRAEPLGSAVSFFASSGRRPVTEVCSASARRKTVSSEGFAAPFSTWINAEAKA